MKAFRNFLGQEVCKIFHANSFKVILSLLVLLVAIDGGFAIQSYNNEMGATLAIPTDQNGFYTEEPWIGIATLYNSWIGGRISGVLPMLFYFLLPVFCVIPYSWSYLSEEKSGYTKLICSKIGTRSYAAAKYLSSFCSGFIIVAIPQILSVLFVSCFVPAYAPEPTYALYYQVDFEKLFGELYFGTPFLYIALYILISSFFGGLWATVPVAVSLFNKNKFVALFSPYIVLLFLIYTAERALVFRGYFTTSPLNFIRPTRQGQAEYPWIFALELLLIAIPVCGMVLWKGGKKDVF